MSTERRRYVATRFVPSNESPSFNRWVLILSITLLGLFSFVAWYLQRQFPTLESEQSLGSNVGFFLLINLNIIVVLVLAFLVVKNVVKLSLDRRRKILGAKLRTRLVVAFVGLSLIPTVLLFTVAKGIVERVLQGWFSPQVEASVDGAVEIASLYYEESEQGLRHLGLHLSARLEQIAPYLLGKSVSEDSREVLAAYLEEKRREYGLFELALYRSNGRMLVEARASFSKVERAAVNTALLRRALRNAQVHAEQSLTAEFLRAYVPVQLPLVYELLGRSDEESEPQGAADMATLERLVLVATKSVPPQISSSLAEVIAAHDDYRELRTYRRPLASSYFLTLVIVTLLIIFAAVWVGFYLARGISVPIGLLAEGTQQLAHGNLEYRIPEVGDDELSVLVRSFNTMTEDLKGTTTELVERRRYMEILLAQVDVGVISLDLSGTVTTCNDTALAILRSCDGSSSIVGCAFEQTAPEQIVQAVDELKQQLSAQGIGSVSSQISLETSEGTKHIHVSLTTLRSEQAAVMGYVLLLDNITELVGAQRMAAWREVARRIAHEIKNPLTPIQLSAQRIQRRLSQGSGEEAEERGLVLEATSTIIRQVEILRTLVNEFSRFARMPKTSIAMADLGEILREVVRFFSDAHPDIHFVLKSDPELRPFMLDAEQINRVLTNLLDNSVAAVQSCPEILSGLEQATIEVSVECKPELGMVAVSVIDNGPGVSSIDKPKLFEPYFSTKQSGTGLGLAIVSTIIADHNGYVRLADVEPRGMRFTFELPLRAQDASYRRKQA